MEKIQFKDLPDMTTPLSSANLNLMQDNMEDAIIPIKLISISTTAPESATIGDMYYNTTDNKVYTAIAENTWNSGETPRYDGFYINTSDSSLYYYNGTKLIHVGLDESDLPSVKNEETTSETDVYSCNYINSMRKVLWTNPDPTQEMGAGVLINLSSNDYDELEWVFAYSTTANNAVSVNCLKGMNIHVITMGYNNPTLIRRTISYISDTQYSTNVAKFADADSNTALIPVEIIGVKNS